MDGPVIWDFHSAMALHMDSPVCISLPAQQGYILYSYLDDCLMREVENPCQHHMRIAISCSSVVRVFAHGTIGHQIDPSWWTH